MTKRMIFLLVLSAIGVTSHAQGQEINLIPVSTPANPVAVRVGCDAADPWMQTVLGQLDQVGDIATAEGFETVVEMCGSLANLDWETVSLQLDPFGEYVIVGACDEDCNDLDLEIFRNGQWVDDDFLLDDMPVLIFETVQGGDHELEVSMPSCGADPCRYGVAVFKRP